MINRQTRPDPSTSKPGCRNFMISGSCSFGSRCRFSHAVRRESETTTRSAISDLAVAGDAVFGATGDGAVRLWRAKTKADGGVELTQESEMRLEETPSGLAISDQLLGVGLSSGRVRVVNRTTGTISDFAGTSGSPVHALLFHQNVLIAADWSGQLRFVSADGSTATLAVNLNVKCLLVVGPNLWVGGVQGVAVVELASLRVVARFEIGAPVMNLTLWNSPSPVVLALGLNSTIKLLDVTNGNILSGISIPELEQSNILQNSLTMALVADGVLAVGQRHGWCKLISLVRKAVICSWPPLDKSADCRVITPLAPGLFLIAGSDGKLSVWKLQ